MASVHFTTSHHNGEAVYAMLKPLILACRILGLQTLQIKTNTSIPSYCGILYTMIITTVYISLAYFAICYDDDINDNSSMLQMLSNKHDIFKLGIELVNLVYGIINVKRISKILYRISWLDCQMWKQNVIQSEKDNSILIHIALAILLLVGRGFLSIFIFPTKSIIFQTAFFIADAFKIFTVLVFYNLMRLVSQRLKKVNDLLKSIVKFKRKNIGEGSNINHNDVNALVIVKQLNNFSCYHDHLCETVTLTNEAFMTLLLLLVVDSFIRSLITVSEVSYYILGHESHPYEVISKTLWSCVILGEFFLTVSICESVLADVAETGRILHQLAVVTNDSRIENTVYVFLLQLLHTKPVFGICGMFAMDNTLVYEVGGLLTMFMIFMVQFKDAKY